MAICFVFLFSACSGEVEYKDIEGFELRFFPEEYEEEYNETSQTLVLEANTDYQLKIKATCDSGTMQLSIRYEGTEKKTFIVNEDAPCDELLAIPANTTNEVIIAVSIEPDTKGEVIGELQVPKK